MSCGQASEAAQMPINLCKAGMAVTCTSRGIDQTTQMLCCKRVIAGVKGRFIGAWGDESEIIRCGNQWARKNSVREESGDQRLIAFDKVDRL
jgi:hypothetical protein